MKRRPIRTGILLVITVALWLLAFKASYPAELPPAEPGTGRHLPHIEVGAGTLPVTAKDPAYTFSVPTGFAVHPATGDLVPVSWLPTDAHISHHATTVDVDTDELSNAELATSTEANPIGTPTEVVDTYALSDFRVVVSGGGNVHTAYHDRTVITFTSNPPNPTIDTYDPAVFPTAIDAILSGLTFG